MTEQVWIHCTQTNVRIQADVLYKSEKTMKVVIPIAFITLNFKRDDNKKPYVATSAGLEFTTMGEIVH